jgi:hypothetical protein
VWAHQIQIKKEKRQTGYDNMRISANILRRNMAHVDINLFIDGQMIGKVVLKPNEEREFLARLKVSHITDLTKERQP